MLRKRDFNETLGDFSDLVENQKNQKVLASVGVYKVLTKTQQAVSSRRCQAGWQEGRWVVTVGGYDGWVSAGQ